MNSLSGLPNIGKILEGQLKEVGIDTYELLNEIGSKKAWLKIKEIDESVWVNRLYALEGAIEGIRYHSLSGDKKKELKDFYNLHKWDDLEYS